RQPPRPGPPMPPCVRCAPAVKPHTARVAVVVVAMAVLGWAGFVLWEGANSPKVRWLGSLVSHGSRSGDRVALTFDDGPNAGATLPIVDTLDAHGVKGTLFTVGKALDARPERSRAAMARG